MSYTLNFQRHNFYTGNKNLKTKCEKLFLYLDTIQRQKKLFNQFYLHKIFWFPNLRDIISIKNINMLFVYRARNTIILTLIKQINTETLPWPNLVHY